MSLLKLTGALLALALLGGCATPKTVDYTAYKQARPKSILVLPPINESPEVLGGLIGAALVGTMLGIILSYSICNPLASQVKIVRSKQHRLYIIVKQTLIAYMNGSVPQVALEYGRKTISNYERPSIDAVEQEMMNPGGENKAA